MVYSRALVALEHLTEGPAGRVREGVHPELVVVTLVKLQS